MSSGAAQRTAAYLQMNSFLLDGIIYNSILS